ISHHLEANIEFALPSNKRVINLLLVVGYHIDNRILHHFKANIEFALLSNEHIINLLLVVKYINKANMFEDDESGIFSVVKNVKDYIFEGDEFGIFFVVKNVEDCVFEGNNLNKSDMSKGGETSISSVIKNIESEDFFRGNDPENNSENSENKPKDNPLKKIYTRQMFTSFEVLEQYLKQYSN
ncbi:23441_t:CDS:1, partial [Racocetra persica]